METVSGRRRAAHHDGAERRTHPPAAPILDALRLLAMAARLPRGDLHLHRMGDDRALHLAEHRLPVAQRLGYPLRTQCSGVASGVIEGSAALWVSALPARAGGCEPGPILRALELSEAISHRNAWARADAEVSDTERSQ